ncbi:DICT sensory domain-containing protein [Scytonema sp. PCC 10023]|uniref:DICT sensory domain-containing protein n=1 Tax=Scytonema sp. PCC 10023 TaxID=1680591 RepID=UPI0039C5B5B6
MNFSFAQDVSVYQLALGMQAPPQPLPHSPASLLSLVRSQIDLLIEQQIAATLWVKLPPGKIWHSEIERYHQQLRISDVIRTLHIEESSTGIEGVEENTCVGGFPDLSRLSKSDKDAHSRSEKLSASVRLPMADARQSDEIDTPANRGNALPPQLEPEANSSSMATSPRGSLLCASSDIRIQSLPNSLLRREYFLMVLSPQFCFLILAHRPFRKRRNNSATNRKKNPPLLAISTFDGKVIQRVLDVIKQAITPESSVFIPNDFICPPASEPTLISQLLAKQLQQQDEIHRQRTTKRLAHMQQQNQKLQETLQLQDEYLSNVCQELRAPLTHMKTALSLLNSPNLKPPQRQRYFQMLKQECDRQNALITGVLDLVQLERNLERIPLEPVRLSDIVPGVVSIYQPLTREKGIMLAYTVPTDLPPVWCVSGGLRQIVINLLSNSIKFTPKGGQVWVRARVQGDYVQLEFRDTGIGIADSEIPKILNRFYRVRPVATEDPGGVGLGLSIVQLLLWRCGGSLSVKSKLYEGSTLTAQLAIAL